LVVLPNGFLAAFSQNRIYFSEAYQPHAWNPDNALSVHEDIVGLGVSGNSLIVCTKSNPYAITGWEPGILAITKTNINQSCVSKRSIADIGTGIIYASPNGLVQVAEGVGGLVTEELFTDIEWNTLYPETMICEVHNRNLHCITSSHAIIYDLDDRGILLTSHDFRPTGMYTHLQNDSFYMIIGDKIMNWNRGGALCEVSWLSREYSFPVPVEFSVARLIHEGEFNFNVYDNNIKLASIKVRSNEAFRLPLLHKSKYWAFEITGFGEVHEMTVCSSMREL